MQSMTSETQIASKSQLETAHAEHEMQLAKLEDHYRNETKTIADDLRRISEEHEHALTTLEADQASALKAEQAAHAAKEEKSKAELWQVNKKLTETLERAATVDDPAEHTSTSLRAPHAQTNAHRQHATRLSRIAPVRAYAHHALPPPHAIHRQIDRQTHAPPPTHKDALTHRHTHQPRTDIY